MFAWGACGHQFLDWPLGLKSLESPWIAHFLQVVLDDGNQNLISLLKGVVISSVLLRWGWDLGLALLACHATPRCFAVADLSIRISLGLHLE